MEVAANRELSRAWDIIGSVREDLDCCLFKGWVEGRGSRRVGALRLGRV